MLSHIYIWNFAIVEKLDIDFTDGLTVLTGETGAGKSILLDALGLALGDRADNTVIRHGSDKAEISVTFSTDKSAAAEAWLADNEMQSEQECIIRRVINAKGGSKAFINGVPSTVQQLKALGEMLVDLHGQHEHQSLLQKEVQRDLLDDYAAHQPLLRKISDSYTQWNTLQKEFDRLSQANQDRDDRLSLLRYQVQELDTLNLQENEYSQLEIEHKKLANAKNLLQTSQQVLNRSHDDENSSIESLLNLSLSELTELKDLDPTLQPIHELFSSALIQTQEANSELRHYIDGLELDPQRLSEVEQRISDALNLSRKHRIKPNEIVELLPVLQKELDNLENADVKMDELLTKIEEAKSAYLKHAKKLSASRIKVAASLSEKVTDSMQGLSLSGGLFEIEIDALEEDKWNQHGCEQINFLVSANPGQPPKALSKVASGGELSRISLAIQVITSQSARIPTLIFDEVDVGIGGSVAEIVGLQLRALGQQKQVICVTHLPQVAALGHHHLQVQKQTENDVTFSAITPLDNKQRVDEVARMLGGIEITEQTRSHAEEMIERAQV